MELWQFEEPQCEKCPDPDLAEDPKDINEIQLVNNINVLTSIEVPTLSMVSLDSADPNYALVKRFGAGLKKVAADSSLHCKIDRRGRDRPTTFFNGRHKNVNSGDELYKQGEGLFRDMRASARARGR